MWFEEYRFLGVTLNVMLSSLLSLLILMMLNLGLFFKLWAMEDVAHRLYLSTKHRLRERSEARSDDWSAAAVECS